MSTWFGAPYGAAFAVETEEDRRDEQWLDACREHAAEQDNDEGDQE